MTASNRFRLMMFADGVNQFCKDSYLLPRVFYTHGLNGEFDPWRPQDTLAILKFIHFEMSEPAIESKLLRYDLLQSGLDPNVIDLLAPPASAVHQQQRGRGYS